MRAKWHPTLVKLPRLTGHRTLMGGVLAAAVMGGLHTLPSAQPAPQNATIALEGHVQDVAGNPVPHAYVAIDGTTASADSAGRFTVAVPVKAHLPALAWAPGFGERQVVLDLPAHLDPSAGIIFDFSGVNALQSALVNTDNQAVVKGLPIESDSSTRTVHLNGVAGVPLDHHLAVTLPDGTVKTYPLSVNGKRFSATLPLQQPGAFRVEINATSGLAVFNILTFHSAQPVYPQGAEFPAEPTGASDTERAAYALSLVNQFRSSMHRKPFMMRDPISHAALAHAADIVRFNYMASHPHVGSNGSTPWQRVRAVDPSLRRVGEVVGMGMSVRQVIQNLLDSPMHRATLLSSLKWAGVGVSHESDGYVVTIDVAR